MPRQAIPKLFVVLLLGASAIVTLGLARDYLVALFGQPVSQWQFAFMLVPVPLAFALLAIAVAWFSQPRLTRFYLLASAMAFAIPCVLSGLVLANAY